MSQHPLQLPTNFEALLEHPAMSRRTARRLGLLGQLVRLWRLWRRRAVERRELAHLDARTLRDIGLTPAQVEYDLMQPFWRPLGDRTPWRR